MLLPGLAISALLGVSSLLLPPGATAQPPGSQPLPPLSSMPLLQTPPAGGSQPGGARAGGSQSGGSQAGTAGAGTGTSGSGAASGSLVPPGSDAGVGSVARLAATGIPVTLSEGQIAVGSTVTLQFVVRGVDAENSEVVEPRYPDIVTRTSGPVIRTYFDASAQSGTQNRSAEVDITFTGVKPGRAVLPPIELKEGRTLYASEPKVLAVADARTGLVPPSLEWSVLQTSPYQGQTIYVQLEVYNVLAPSFPDKVTVTPPAGGVFEEVHGLGKIRTTTVGGTELYQFPATTYFLTPTAEGAVTLPPASVSLGGTAAQAPPLSLTILPLPTDVQKTGAVGDFSFSATIDRKELVEGDTAQLVLRLEGAGNLDYFKFPEVDPGKLVVTGSQEQSKDVATELGYTGYREQTITLSPRGSGATTVTVPAFSWVEPETNRVRTVAAKTFPLTINAAPISAPNTAVGGTAEFTLLSVGQIRNATPANAYGNPLVYLWLLPGILIIVARVVLRKRLSVLPFFASLVLFVSAAQPGPFPEAAIREANAAFAAGDVEGAVGKFEQALAVSPRNPGILYNEALCFFQLHKDGQALYRAFAAVRLLPTNAEFRNALAWMESQIGLSRQVEPPPAVHPDILLAATFVLFTLTSALGALGARRRSGMHVIVVALCAALTVSGAIGTAVMVHLHDTEIGVVGPESGKLLKIPRANASSWLQLPAGTSVDVRLKANGFYLIKTGFGVEGWLPVDEVEYGSLSGSGGTG